MTAKPTPAYIPITVVGTVCLTAIALFGMSMVREAQQERADRISQCRQVVLETYAASDGGGIDLAADLVACDRDA